jgi:hypothetical protein
LHPTKTDGPHYHPHIFYPPWSAHAIYARDIGGEMEIDVPDLIHPFPFAPMGSLRFIYLQKGICKMATILPIKLQQV